MKFAAVLLLTMSTVSLTQGVNSEPLWPAGKTPHRISGDGADDAPFLTVHSARGQENFTGAAVVLCPGGGYGGLAHDHEGRQPAQWFRERGVSAYVLHYRLGSDGYHHPAQLADVQRAIRFVRHGAEARGLDPDRIAVMGFSAGGHLASMAATLWDEPAYEPADAIDETSARPDFAILCYPVISLDPAVTHGGSRRNLLGPERENDEKWASRLSSERNVTGETPPTFLFQTNADAAVPAENATRFFLALRRAGVPTEMHVYQDGPHGVGLYRGDPVLGTWPALLENWLRANAFFAPPRPRVAVSGQVTLDGEPVSWGVLSFHPENERLPVTSVRVRRGRFSADAEEGPMMGKCRLKLEASIWEATGEEDDRVVNLDSFSPGADSPVMVEVEKGMELLRLEYRSE